MLSENYCIILLLLFFITDTGDIYSAQCENSEFNVSTRQNDVFVEVIIDVVLPRL